MIISCQSKQHKCKLTLHNVRCSLLVSPSRTFASRVEPPPELALAHSTTTVYSNSTAFMNAYHIDVHAVLVRAGRPRCRVA
jgi:hypothetical protein